MNKQQAMEEILEAGRRMYQKGFVASNDGNLSARLDDGLFLVTPTGMCKGDMTQEDLIVVDEAGKLVSGRRKITSEVKMHLAVYRTRPDVCAVVHAHPQKATAFAVAHLPMDEIILPEMVFGLGKINLTEYGTPSTTEIPDTVEKYIVDANALLLRNHGALTVGKTPMEAYFSMETLEHYAAISLYAKLLGGAVPISQEDKAKLFAVRQSVYGKDNSIFEKE